MLTSRGNPSLDEPSLEKSTPLMKVSVGACVKIVETLRFRTVSAQDGKRK